MTHEATGPIAFIGGGNMARSLIGGLVAQGCDPASLHVAEPVESLAEGLAREFGVHVYARAKEAVAATGTWVLAVKPQVMRAVCEELAGAANASPLVVSIAAGITTGQLDRWLDGGAAIVRAMPNTPALIGQGVTGLFATAKVSARQKEATESLLRSCGPTAWIADEALMDAVTAVSGSGPAYVFLLAEAMQAAAERQGLAADTAALLVRQTLAGSAAMLGASGEPASVLRSRVTSPGGTTQAAVDSLQAGGFANLLDEAIERATQRGRELSAANDRD